MSTKFLHIEKITNMVSIDILRQKVSSYFIIEVKASFQFEKSLEIKTSSYLFIRHFMRLDCFDALVTEYYIFIPFMMKPHVHIKTLAL